MKRRFAMLSLVCLLAVGAGAKKEYPLSLQVESEANMESQHPSFRFGFHSWGGGSSGGGVTSGRTRRSGYISDNSIGNLQVCKPTLGKS